jgi:predicted amidophosphoribosyltransferase
MVLTLKGHKRFWAGIAIFGDYKPWSAHKEDGGDGSNYPEHSGRILDLKDGKASAVNHFAAMIEPTLPNNIVIAVVPSHDPQKLGGGLKDLAVKLAERGNRIDGSRCLVRTKKIDKLAHGGDRSKEVHVQSIGLISPALIRGKDVLLLDDVTKTGNSLFACKEILTQAGARSVLCATIGKT